MITPDEFYTRGELPSTEGRERMWSSIEAEIRTRKRSLLFIPDRRSFVYGIAASILIYFTAVGVYTTVRNAIVSAQPEAIRLDEAYQSAIEQFERIVPAVTSNGPVDERRENLLTMRKEQLNKLNEAINELKRETLANDVSPLKQKRLRNLYSMKLQVLQDMIENGEIEL